MIYISSELPFIKLLTTSKVFFYFGMVKHQLLKIGCNQTRYISRGTCLEWFSSPEKSSASLGDNKDKKYLCGQ